MNSIRVCTGCMFLDFSGAAVLTVGDGDSSVSLVNCTLANNTIWPDTWYDEGHALISAMASEYRDDYAPWIVQKTTVSILLDQCRLEGNRAQHTLLATGAEEVYEPQFFSSASLDVYLMNYDEKVESKPLDEAPKGSYLTGNEEWIQELREVPPLNL
jgi:hypothetical protein